MAEIFQTQTVVMGVEGLNLQDSVDIVKPTQLLQMTNVVGNKQTTGELQSRPGQTEVAAAGTQIHSLDILQNAANVSGNATIVAGADNGLYYGLAGALTLAELGFSGNPLSFAAYRPTDSAYPWLYIGDSNKMRKIRIDGLTLPIGLPAPTVTAITVLNPEKSTDAELFTDTAGWGTFAYDGSAVPSQPIADTNPATGNGLEFTTTPGAAVAAYANAWDRGFGADFTKVGGVPASDSDYISFYMKLSDPTIVNDVRLDFGVGGTGGNFYTKHFRPSDFTQVSISGEQSSIVGEDQVARYQQTDLALNIIDDSRDIAELHKAQRQQRNTQSLQTVTGAGTWTEFGTYGVVLRRGDFLRRGADESVGWADIQSITVTVFVNTNSAVSVSLSDLRLVGGAGLDTGEFGLSSYDYRYINVDTRTGAKSNPSPEQDVTAVLDSLRRSITVSPTSYGDDSVRQWIYRRGGTLNDNWYFLGINSADGADFVDDISDAQAAAGLLLELDNNQPIATADFGGNTVLSKPVPSIFGPVQDYLFACGDPYKAGNVYYSKPGQPDSWPPQNSVEVCPPSEILQAGGVYGTQAFVFSRLRLYFLLPNANALGAVTSLPTPCLHGLFSRWGFVVGKDGIYFISYDGIYLTTGGQEVYLSLDIQPLFNNEVKNGYQPIDFTVPNALKLEIHDNDLWFLYQDITGNRQVMVYSLLAKYWRHYNFSNFLAGICSDSTYPRLLLSGKDTGKIYTHTGFSDAGNPINCLVTLPYLAQEIARQMKTYGDVTVDYAIGDSILTITPSLDTGLTTLPPVLISSVTQADL
jgi:hypothetical protein